jgi:hypothetical protein
MPRKIKGSPPPDAVALMFGIGALLAQGALARGQSFPEPAPAPTPPPAAEGEAMDLESLLSLFVTSASLQEEPSTRCRARSP